MPETQTLILFAAAALALLATPGPAIVYVVTRSLSGGVTAGLASSLGLCAGLLVHVVASAFGVSALLARWPPALRALQVAGGCYLLWLAWSALRSRPHTAGEDRGTERPRSLRRLFWDGVVIDTLNPKPALFFLAFLPQFTNPGLAVPVHLQLLALGALFVAIALITNSTYALIFGRIGRGLGRTARAARIQRRASAAFLFTLGVYALVQAGRRP